MRNFFFFFFEYIFKYIPNLPVLLVTSSGELVRDAWIDGCDAG